MVWSEMQPRQRSFCWIFRFILHSMAKKITFLKGNLCIHKRFIVVLHFFSFGAKTKLQNALRFEMDFVLSFAMCSADFTRVKGSTIQIMSLANYLKGLTFLILNANFQGTVSLSIVLSFFIHKISSRILRHPSWNSSHLTRITFAKLSANFIQFLLSGSVLDTFRHAANEFYVKICFTVYSRHLIWEGGWWDSTGSYCSIWWPPLFIRNFLGGPPLCPKLLEMPHHHHSQRRCPPRVFGKAQCLVHYTSLINKQQLMLLDIQGSRYSLYDPEIATADIIDEGEVFFCCGNLSSTSTDRFNNDHICNKYRDMVQKVLDSEWVKATCHVTS